MYAGIALVIISLIIILIKLPSWIKSGEINELKVNGFWLKTVAILGIIFWVLPTLLVLVFVGSVGVVLALAGASLTIFFIIKLWSWIKSGEANEMTRWKLWGIVLGVPIVISLLGFGFVALLLSIESVDLYGVI